MPLLTAHEFAEVTSGGDTVTSGGDTVTSTGIGGTAVLVDSLGVALSIGHDVAFTSIPGGIYGDALGDVILSRSGDRERQALAMAGVVCSWETNAAGEFSAFAKLEDVRAIEPSLDALRGWWLIWEVHPHLPTWGGRITDVVVTADQTVELDARGWLDVLAKRLTRRRNTSISATAGAIAARLVRDTNLSDATGLSDVAFDDAGAFVSWQDDGGEVLDALSRLADLSGQEFCVDEDTRAFSWRNQCGSDLTSSVQLVQGRHIVDWRPAWSLEPIITEVVLDPADKNRFRTAPAVSGFADAAYTAYGPRQARGTYRGQLPRAAAQAVASRQASSLADRGRLIECDVVDADGCFAWFRRGDTITVVLADIDRALAVRILVMSYDQSSDLVRISGEITDAGEASPT